MVGHGHDLKKQHFFYPHPIYGSQKKNTKMFRSINPLMIDNALQFWGKFYFLDFIDIIFKLTFRTDAKGGRGTFFFQPQNLELFFQTQSRGTHRIIKAPILGQNLQLDKRIEYVFTRKTQHRDSIGCSDTLDQQAA